MVNRCCSGFVQTQSVEGKVFGVGYDTQDTGEPATEAPTVGASMAETVKVQRAVAQEPDPPAVGMLAGIRESNDIVGGVFLGNLPNVSVHT